MVKVTDSWLPFHVFETCAAEDPPCRENQCMLNKSKLRRPPEVVVWKLIKGASSYVTLVTGPWFKITRSFAKSPRVVE
ncbi:hypothetical protein TNCV_453501 [Trichonephila clavipes]|nr:hypothetical protein TNCV_453501 [Trichonephila clavipes]